MTVSINSMWTQNSVKVYLSLPGMGKSETVGALYHAGVVPKGLLAIAHNASQEAGCFVPPHSIGIACSSVSHITAHLRLLVLVVLSVQLLVLGQVCVRRAGFVQGYTWISSSSAGGCCLTRAYLN